MWQKLTVCSLFLNLIKKGLYIYIFFSFLLVWRFRILSGLWPLYNGTVKRPLINDLYYVPQRPYLAIGSLRDQIIYPDSVEDMKRKSIQDKDLMVILEVVNLQQVVIREGGWNLNYSILFLALPFYEKFTKRAFVFCLNLSNRF